MKLTLKHLASYLPYGLKFVKNDKTYYGEAHRGETGKLAYETTRKGELLGIKKNLNKIITRVGSFGISNQSKIVRKRFIDSHITFKPILRPLSDLTKEIKINGEKFVPITTIELEVEQWCDAYQEWMDAYIDYPRQLKVMQAPYEIIEKLFEWHFDVFGLIDEGLAIDINTL